MTFSTSPVLIFFFLATPSFSCFCLTPNCFLDPGHVQGTCDFQYRSRPYPCLESLQNPFLERSPDGPQDPRTRSLAVKFGLSSHSFSGCRRPLSLSQKKVVCFYVRTVPPFVLHIHSLCATSPLDWTLHITLATKTISFLGGHVVPRRSPSPGLSRNRPAGWLGRAGLFNPECEPGNVFPPPPPFFYMYMLVDVLGPKDLGAERPCFSMSLVQGCPMAGGRWAAFAPIFAPSFPWSYVAPYSPCKSVRTSAPLPAALSINQKTYPLYAAQIPKACNPSAYDPCRFSKGGDQLLDRIGANPALTPASTPSPSRSTIFHTDSSLRLVGCNSHRDGRLTVSLTTYLRLDGQISPVFRRNQFYSRPKLATSCRRAWRMLLVC